MAGTFPHFNRCGPIEACGAKASPAQGNTGFRVLIGAAPLKLLQHTVDRGRVVAFPRFNQRGSIEACTWGSRSVRSAMFPRLNRRGPIEVLQTASSHACTSCFRVLIDAAPLKLPAMKPHHAPSTSFRAFIGAALLKHGVLRDPAGRTGRFPRLNRRGPIEAPPGNPTALSGPHVSAS